MGLIAGSGRFPLLILEQAVEQGLEMVVAAIQEEADPAIEAFPGQGPISIHWVGLGKLGKLIRLFRKEGVRQAVLAGQVQHTRIFARPGSDGAGRQVIVPDWKMLRVYQSLTHKNTQSLIQGVIGALEKEGIRMSPPTRLLEPLLARGGVLTRRAPNPEELRDMEYGRPLARQVAALDLGQTIVVKDQAVVAVEAMEGTDDTIRRASRLVNGGRLTVVKVSRPDQDMRFDVPVVGLDTLRVLEECNVSALSIDAGKTLLLDRQAFLSQSDSLGIAVVAA